LLIWNRKPSSAFSSCDGLKQADFQQELSSMLRQREILSAIAVSALMLGLAACDNTNTAATRAADRAAGTNTSGAYPTQSDGTRANPSGTEATRALDRASGTNTSGAYPTQSNGMPGNPPGTEATRALDRAACTNTSGAFPTQADGTPCNPPGTAAGRAVNRAR
jgi:hypothetical protein